MEDYDIITKKGNKTDYQQHINDNSYLITVNDTPYCFTYDESNAKKIVYNISKQIQTYQKLQYPHCNYNINYTLDGAEIVSNNHYNIVLVDLVEFYIKYKKIQYKKV